MEEIIFVEEGPELDEKKCLDLDISSRTNSKQNSALIGSRRKPLKCVKNKKKLRLKFFKGVWKKVWLDNEKKLQNFDMERMKFKFQSVSKFCKFGEFCLLIE